MMDSQSYAHSSSTQQHVGKNHDPALVSANEHVHEHLHHTAHAEQGRAETEYSKETTYEESNVPSQDAHDQPAHRRNPSNGPKTPAMIADAEKGDLSRHDSSEQDPRTHTLSNIYLKYRIFFHLFIWLLFTGFVDFYFARVYIFITFANCQTWHIFLSCCNKVTNSLQDGGSQDLYCMGNMIR